MSSSPASGRTPLMVYVRIGASGAPSGVSHQSPAGTGSDTSFGSSPCGKNTRTYSSPIPVLRKSATPSPPSVTRTRVGVRVVVLLTMPRWMLTESPSL